MPPRHDEQRPPAGRRDQLAEPAARRAQRIPLAHRDPPEPDRLGRLDDRRAVRKLEPPRSDRPAERIRDRRLPPLPAERRVQRVRRALATVRDGTLLRVGTRITEARGKLGSRVARGQHALERRRRDERAH